MAAITICSDFGAQEIKSLTISIVSPFTYHEVIGPDAMTLVFLIKVMLLGTPKILMDFPVVMYGCESWTIKKAERQRLDAFELWYCRRLLRVPWTARRSNQSMLKEISPEYSWKD